MTDPAVEAAQRARAYTERRSRHVQRVAAAREALKPVREWFDENYGMSRITDDLLDHLAPLIHTTEELER